MKYQYTFSLWPAEYGGWPRDLFDVFRLLNTRVAMVFTEAEWAAFRARLEAAGFTLRVIVRVPYQEPEVVL